MSSTAQQFIDGALMDLGVRAAGVSTPAHEASDALIVLNQLRDSLGVDRLLMFRTIRTTKALTSGTASYTIGAGGDINITRPSWIDYARLIIDTSATTPTEVWIANLTDDEYAARPAKTQQSSQPDAIWYDKRVSDGLGRIWVFDIPSVNTTQLVLYTPGDEVAVFADLDTVYTFHKGYERAIRKNLALELAPGYPGAQPSPLLLRQAAESKAAIQMANVKPIPVFHSPGLSGTGGFFNIETGRSR